MCTNRQHLIPHINASKSLDELWDDFKEFSSAKETAKNDDSEDLFVAEELMATVANTRLSIHPSTHLVVIFHCWEMYVCMYVVRFFIGL